MERHTESKYLQKTKSNTTMLNPEEKSNLLNKKHNPNNNSINEINIDNLFVEGMTYLPKKNVKKKISNVTADKKKTSNISSIKKITSNVSSIKKNASNVSSIKKKPSNVSSVKKKTSNVSAVKKKLNKNLNSFSLAYNRSFSKNSFNLKNSNRSISSSLFKLESKNYLKKRSHFLKLFGNFNSNSSLIRSSSQNLHMKIKNKNNLAMSDFRDDREISPKLFKEAILKLNKKINKNKNLENDNNNNKIYKINFNSSKSAMNLKNNSNENSLHSSPTIEQDNYIITIRKKSTWEKSKTNSSGDFFNKKVTFGNGNSNKSIQNSSSKKPRSNKKTRITILNSTKELKDKIIDIITMDEVRKKLKESIIKSKDELKKELHDLETNDICEAIEKLPIKSSSNLESCKSLEKNESLKNTKTEKNRFLEYKGLVYDSLDDDEEIDEIEIYSFYMSPNSYKVYFIDCIVLISAFIQLFYLPIYLAINSEFCRNNYQFHQILFYIIDIIYIIDFITEFFKAYYDINEFMIKNKDAICKKYLSSWFFLDFIQAIPIYTILVMLEKKCEISNIKHYNNMGEVLNNLQYILTILKILKIFKIFMKNTFLKKVDNILNDYDFFFLYKNVLFTMLIAFGSLNFSACLLIFFGRNSYPGWIIHFNLQNQSFIYIYVTAVYFLMASVSTVGYGDIYIKSNIERVYQIIILISGTVAYSWVVSYISNFFKKMNEKYLDYENKMIILQEIKIAHPNLSEELYHKINRFLLNNKYKKKDNNEIVNYLPYPLKNILFMEMYKPIIKNFNFFKSFENSNFIAKVVTSFKSVLSIKGDILIQEGDVIEDIIFVKKGVLSIDLCIDMNSAKESIQNYLEDSDFGKIKKNFTKSLISINTNSLYKKNSNNNYINQKKFLKIIDIRNNEHFGDIFMFLNKRIPYSVRVKSSKAELYYLNKTDCIEISTIYPNIWKRIMKISLFNMKQIKKLAKKILIDFSQANGIQLDEKIVNNDNQINSTNSKNEEEKNTDKKLENRQKNSTILEVKEEYIESNSNILKSTIISNSEKLKSNLSLMNNQKKTSKLSLNKNIKKTVINSSKDKKKIEKCLSLSDRNKKNFSESSPKSKKSRFIKDTNKDEEHDINYEIYTNEKLNENSFLRSHSSTELEKNLDKCTHQSNDFNEKEINNYNNNLKSNNISEINFINISNKINEIYSNNSKIKSENSSLTKKSKNLLKLHFDNLSISNSSFTTINSSYSNLNEITNYKFSKNSELQQKTIQFVLNECSSSEKSEEESNNQSSSAFGFSSLTPKFKKYNSVFSPKKRKKTGEYINHIFTNHLNAKKLNFNLTQNENDVNNKINIGLEKKGIKVKKHLTNLEVSNPHNSGRSRKNISKKKSIKKNNENEQEMNFYNKIKTGSNNINTINNKMTFNKKRLSKKKVSYLDVISHNIFEDRLNLKNPQKFYAKFFASLIEKQKHSKRKSTEVKNNEKTASGNNNTSRNIKKKLTKHGSL